MLYNCVLFELYFWYHDQQYDCSTAMWYCAVKSFCLDNIIWALTTLYDTGSTVMLVSLRGIGDNDWERANSLYR